jgi:YidC/Oxa1 family membrane protein insertase
MEQSRLFIAIAISFLIFFLWSKFFAPLPPQVPSEAVKEETQSSAEKPDQKAPAVEAKAEPVKPVMVEKPSKKARTLTVDTPLYKITLSEKGGAVTGFVLKEYRETIEQDSMPKELIHKDTNGGSVLVALSGQGQPDFETAVFSTDLDEDTLEVKDSPSQIRFQYQAGSGLIVEKIYSFAPDSYLIDLKVKVYNGSDQNYQGSLAVGLRNSLDKDAGKLSFEGPSGFIEGQLQQIKIKDIEEQNKFSGKINWVAIEDRYFMTSIIPAGDFNGNMILAVNDKTVQNQLVKDIGNLSPQQSEGVTLKLFMGPKNLSLLKSFKNHLDKAINFGWFDFLAKPCLWFMNFIYGFIPNYGIAIIILTIVTRAAFWPLAKKSYKSMGEMRKIQPLMQEIREKYKDDKTRMNQEMMTLYRTYKINPMGGCLPMLIQLPVFFALYRMLYSAIELRHAPFFGWITDLAAPDRLFNFGIKIPFMEPPYGIPVLTLIMGASMLLQQKMTPTPGDPAQAKMMMLMPVIFTFIFINFSSGLVLYWLVSNIFSMAQQYYTQKRTA